MRDKIRLVKYKVTSAIAKGTECFGTQDNKMTGP